MRRKFLRRYRAVHRGGKRQIKERPYIIPISGLLLGLCIVAAMFFSHSAATLKPGSDAHIVFLFDNGHREVLDTKAKTVGELVVRLPLHLIAEDVVEPAYDTPIVEDNFRINVYRARPVVVIDNNVQRLITLTAQKSPRVVAQNAGLEVFPEDQANFQQGSLKENIIGEKVVINRATPVAFNLYGTTLDIHTRSKTVGELLIERQVKLAQGDSVQPAPETPITSNIQVAVIRNGTQVATVTEAIPAPIQYVEDASLSFGTTAVRQAGSDGKRIVTYQIQTQNGKETSRNVIQQTIAAQPVTKIVARGKTIDISGDKSAVMAAAGISSGDYGYVNFVISRESNWNPNSRNASGCLGLGQACPGSKLIAVCPNLDAVCQLRFFSGYANGRYGGWGGAYNFWLSHHYW